jgi:hypothetical protein
MVKGVRTRVPPRGMAYTLPPSCLSHPATISPACTDAATTHSSRDDWEGSSKPSAVGLKASNCDSMCVR